MRVGIYEIRDPNSQDLSVQQAYEKILAHNGIPSVRLRTERRKLSAGAGGEPRFLDCLMVENQRAESGRYAAFPEQLQRWGEFHLCIHERW